MYVIQNFSSQYINKINPFEKLIWLIGLIHYKTLGYTTKLYCNSEDIKFLKDNNLFNYYDEIDTTTLSECDWLNNVNQDAFWFFRKIIAIEKEFELNHDFFYSDTDIILNETPDFSDCDIYTWTLENVKNPKVDGVYCDWSKLSTPEGYQLPEYLKNTDSCNYNCGILYIKNKEIFHYWKKEMLDFARNNPCKTYDLAEGNCFFACNCEQRILTGIVKEKNLKAKILDENPESNGIGPKGVHFFQWRHSWRTAKKREEQGEKEGPIAKQKAIIDNWTLIFALKDFIKDFLNRLLMWEHFDEYAFFMNNPEVYKLLQLDTIYEIAINWYSKEAK